MRVGIELLERGQSGSSIERTCHCQQTGEGPTLSVDSSVPKSVQNGRLQWALVEQSSSGQQQYRTVFGFMAKVRIDALELSTDAKRHVEHRTKGTKIYGNDVVIRGETVVSMWGVPLVKGWKRDWLGCFRA